ncbi:hypothetical protein ACJ73_01974 [Blastomyces percursus]|uniref:Alpha/beta hydrolase fold-3 domain-containing protein n=1 Tax=Blastomyces percursus TaxID=1658174 RepID=A0A1J9QDN8_9EURO|nr:hypothetical protein ACJ73_01974 [Blastomyces percursus]
MPYNALSVGVAVTPTVISTFLSHYTNRKANRSKPTAHLSYHQGLRIIREFLYYSSLHTVEQLQIFTSQWVPSPRWIKVNKVRISEDHLASAADLLIIQLGSEGLLQVGGNKWWKWRGKKPSLEGEWVEMQRDFADRQRQHVRCNRVMLYIHGGAYYFGSLNSHRYQIQRHAKKLKARVFARILVTLRDQGMPLPAGSILISPWVDLTHSFPSVAGDGPGDYIPPYGFMHRPSISWPPPNSDELDAITKAGKAARGDGSLRTSSPTSSRSKDAKAVGRGPSRRTPSVNSKATSVGDRSYASSISQPHDIFHNRNRPLEVEIDGEVVELKDQIHMYTTNELLSHPLVSPVLQPSLGGLPPMLVLTGGAELLRDEQIYLAHKAADPTYFLPSEKYLDRHDPDRRTINRYPPTFVQLQVWDDLCHVTPTLSFTRPAKYMFRSIAQFGAWALARAQKRGIDIPIHESEISSSDSDNPHASAQKSAPPSPYSGFTTIGKAGDPLPPFEDYMIRQRVDDKGNIYPLAARSHLTALQMLPEEIGVPKPGPVSKWLRAKEAWDVKFAKQKSAVQQQRLQEIKQGIGVFRHGEYPPPSSLASRKDTSVAYEEEEHKTNRAMWLWSRMASKHDTEAIEKPQPLGGNVTHVSPKPSIPKSTSRKVSLREKFLPRVKQIHRHSRQSQTVLDLGQASESFPMLEPPPRSAKRTTPQPTVAGLDETTSDLQPSEEFQPGFSGGPRVLNHDRYARRASSVYTDDASTRSIKDAEGVISPLFSRSRPDVEFKTPRETPDISVIPDSPGPEQNGAVSIGGQFDGERSENAWAFHGQLLVERKVAIGGDVGEDTSGVHIFGRNKEKSRY